MIGDVYLYDTSQFPYFNNQLDNISEMDTIKIDYC